MQNNAFFDLPFIQVALPIIVAFALATLAQNKGIESIGKRIDDLRADFNKRFDGMDKRLDKIEDRLQIIETKLYHGEHLARLVERSSLLHS